MTDDRARHRGDTHHKAEGAHSRGMEEGQEMMDTDKVAMTRPMKQAHQPHLLEQVSIRMASNIRLRHQAAAHPTMARLAEEFLDPRPHHRTGHHPYNAHTRSRLFHRLVVMMMGMVLPDTSKAMAARGMTVSSTYTIIILTVAVCLVLSHLPIYAL